MTMDRLAAVLLIASASTGMLGGCAQQGPLLSHRGTLSSLKASVSHLEFENQQLQRQVADLRSENRQIEDRLVQEESANGDLTARLDDARNALRARGADWDEPRSAAQPGPQTLPAGRSTRKRRKAPFVRIPGQIDTVPPIDPGPQSWRDDDRRWLPIAQGPIELR